MRKLLIVVAVAGLAVVGAGAFLQQTPRAVNRRSLMPAEVERLRASSRRTGDWNARFFDSVGVSTKLRPDQLDYYRARGTNEFFLLRYLASQGITPEQSEALAAEGVNMALADPTQMTAYHWAALSDVVVAGEVAEVSGNPKGPYHTKVDLQAQRYLKDATGERADRVSGALLRTGPRRHATGEQDAMDEPDLKPGERVVLFLSREPFNLTALVGSTLANVGSLPASFEQDYGTMRDLVRKLDKPTDLEVLMAYKIVHDKAVLKCRAYRIASPSDVIDLGELAARVERVAAAQERAAAGRRVR
jgi:hypothetical protein